MVITKIMSHSKALKGRKGQSQGNSVPLLYRMAFYPLRIVYLMAVPIDDISVVTQLASKVDT